MFVKGTTAPTSQNFLWSFNDSIHTKALSSKPAHRNYLIHFKHCALICTHSFFVLVKRDCELTTEKRSRPGIRNPRVRSQFCHLQVSVPPSKNESKKIT